MQKKVLLCVSGGIAAYKAVQLTSKLTQNGFDVKVMMTGNATKFVTPLSFQAISRNDVYTDTFDEKDPAKIAHIDLADWPDVIIIAPATANIIGKLANGIADDMVSTTLLATEKPVFIAPAMNVHMYNHPVVQENIARLKSFGYHFIEPSEGYLACGYVGKGRLEEPEIIVEHVKTFFVQNKQQFLRGKTVLISAGPTREKIDPVRYLSNYSSGKMGYAIAEVAQHLGANVILISGPVSLEVPVGVQIIRVESAEEMYEAVLQYFDEADIVIKSAAVSDYRPKKIFQQKMKKQSQELVIELERTVDILAELGKRKKAQFLIGFAAETNHVEEYAKQKLLSKNADMIVANNVMQEGAGFGTDTNIVTFYKANNEKKQFPKLTKHEVAYEILKEAYEAKKGE
ncbi:bifunctional phosphopantothenoylcysteine decarboxylase/phosphopantothenate--cysteine ligase CoaBC [Caldibacillus thermoamylovorans]|mgnify:FL=1|uniref:bifunctional phosphopantothenoylcysteine decarboxylase/phosphopantothenate--cysteine ligase CoaBC n=1 Tax=Bacillaceae TaxID=186817 RepID=UPI000BA4B693|nr:MULTISPECIES: bifunctional phosphopantothenoylcysteine decarboxylase/phosphopantothenate--cysteine ligase CoaBC [Bacillaceae]MCB5933980.1 bifunctional phosphopantothenoylcysteine decarboxylase/phosphopantothenate--cysteine ligase CoaBC [Bacillus sp. DFI.2.34]NWN97373.1 bifunctional phosphopantothenoylcysteine decarboxylase/phosphopantothenate--cysteine ligase CoaBC [Bacillus sp. (in: firmicutes)]AWI12104.1 bifunctional phosphopantothenoylcysteine decarboxylase/phosphopantothenate--cysteine li